MKHRLGLSAISVVALIAGIVAYQKTDFFGTKESPAQTLSSNAPPLSSAAHLKAAVEIAGTTPLPSAGGIGDLRTGLAQGEFAKGEEAYFLVQATNLCENARQPPLKNSTVSAKALYSYATHFCKDFSGSSGAETAKLLELRQGDPVVDAFGAAASLYEIIAASPPDKNALKAATNLLDDKMLSSKAGVDGLIAAEALQQAGYVSPKVSTLARAAGLQLGREDLGKAQILAAQMQVCSRYGACGQGQLMTMQFCGSLGVCKPGISSQEVWQRSYSPDVYLAAQEINRRGRG